MTRIVFSELLGGRVFEIDDLEVGSLAQVGDIRLGGPSGPAVDPVGRVLVAELNNHFVALAEPGGPWQRFGSHGSGVGEFDLPVATAFLGNSLLVLDARNCRVVSIDDIGGGGWAAYGERGLPGPGDPAEGRFADPRGLAVDTSGRIWVSDPGADRVTRIDSIDGGGWTEVPLPPAPAPALPLGLGAAGDGVAVLDAGNRRIVVLDPVAGTAVLDLAGAPWIGPAFVAGPGGRLVAADVTANELRLLELDGAGGFEVVAALRGSPPDMVQPIFDSVGGVAS
jgi:DNA-binding beta-propeller fold protein YncE